MTESIKKGLQPKSESGSTGDANNDVDGLDIKHSYGFRIRDRITDITGTDAGNAPAKWDVARDIGLLFKSTHSFLTDANTAAPVVSMTGSGKLGSISMPVSESTGRTVVQLEQMISAMSSFSQTSSESITAPAETPQSLLQSAVASYWGN